MNATPAPAPNLIRLSYVHDVAAPPAALFPLLCPVREFEWIPGWPCRVVYTASGVAEPGCVFVTAGAGEEPTTWLTTSYDPPSGRASYLRVTPGRRVVRLDLRVEPAAPGRSRLHVEFRVSCLGPAARDDLRQVEATGEPYATIAAGIARGTERYLVTGEAVGRIPDLGIHPDARARWSGSAPVAADAEAVFPLLCPVREREWLPGWRCELVHTASGLVEPDCIWAPTSRGASDVPVGQGMVTAVTVHDPVARRLTFAAFSPGRLVEVTSGQVVPQGAGRAQLALEVEVTALDDEGRALVRRVRRDGGPYAGRVEELAAALGRFLSR